jgi:hypothetical protein
MVSYDISKSIVLWLGTIFRRQWLCGEVRYFEGNGSVVRYDTSKAMVLWLGTIFRSQWFCG